LADVETKHNYTANNDTKKRKQPLNLARKLLTYTQTKPNATGNC